MYGIQDIMYKLDFNGPALLSATRSSVHAQLSDSLFKHAVWRIIDALQQAIKENEMLNELSQLRSKRQIPPPLEEDHNNKQSHTLKLKAGACTPEQRVENKTGLPKTLAVTKSVEFSESLESSFPSQIRGNPKPVKEKSSNSTMADFTTRSDEIDSPTQPQQMSTSQSTFLTAVAPSLTTDGLRNLTANSLSTHLKDFQLCLSEETITALIAQGFDGALISIIKEEHVLKDDYGIHTYGERRKIWNAVEVLRQRAKEGDDVQEAVSGTEKRGTKRSFNEVQNEKDDKAL